MWYTMRMYIRLLTSLACALHAQLGAAANVRIEVAEDLADRLNAHLEASPPRVAKLREFVEDALHNDEMAAAIALIEKPLFKHIRHFGAGDSMKKRLTVTDGRGAFETEVAFKLERAPDDPVYVSSRRYGVDTVVNLDHLRRALIIASQSEGDFAAGMALREFEQPFLLRREAAYLHLKQGENIELFLVDLFLRDHSGRVIREVLDFLAHDQVLRSLRRPKDVWESSRWHPENRGISMGMKLLQSRLVRPAVVGYYIRGLNRQKALDENARLGLENRGNDDALDDNLERIRPLIPWALDRSYSKLSSWPDAMLKELLEYVLAQPLNPQVARHLLAKFHEIRGRSLYEGPMTYELIRRQMLVDSADYLAFANFTTPSGAPVQKAAWFEWSAFEALLAAGLVPYPDDVGLFGSELAFSQKIRFSR